MRNTHRKKGVLDMRNTEVNRLEKENNTRGENTMRKNRIRKALIDLGFEKIEGWMYTAGDGKNRYHALGETEVRKALELLTKVSNFDGIKIVKEMEEGKKSPRYERFFSVDLEGNKQYLHTYGGYVDFEFIGNTFQSVIIKYEDWNYGWQEEELY
tara:strand:+ start:1073 stop:1537 length:465 start_codon:yes stop_codon:yes gene_type:complete